MHAKGNKHQIIDRREMLRVKAKSLAAEARIIRREETRALGRKYRKVTDSTGKERTQHFGGEYNPLYHELRLHRLSLRAEARATHLAYGFIRGLTLEQMEPKRYMGLPRYLVTMYDERLMKRVAEMVKKYGPPGMKLMFDAERKAA